MSTAQRVTVRLVWTLLVATIVAALPLGAQTANLSGTWRVDGVGPSSPWTLILKSDGTTLAGTVSTCASGPGAALALHDGIIDGRTIRFTCTSRDGNRTVTLAGTLNGDALDFTWRIDVKPGSSTAPRDSMFGPGAPPRFIAKRIPEATTLDPSSAAEVDITGYYNEKDGEFTRISKTGGVYQYLSHYKVGDWIGVAIREDDHLSIGWHRSDGANLGVSVYKIEKGNKGPILVGGWAAFPGGGVAKDTLTWSRKLE